MVKLPINQMYLSNKNRIVESYLHFLKVLTLPLIRRVNPSMPLRQPGSIAIRDVLLGKSLLPVARKSVQSKACVRQRTGKGSMCPNCSHKLP